MDTLYTDKILIVAGPTASGKSALALNLAKEMDAVIINADSMQVYRELPVLTAQPTPAEQSEVPHRLYGFLTVATPCSVAVWLAHARKAITEAHRQGKTPILVGGTGMYLNALVKGIAMIPDVSQKVRQNAREMMDELGNQQFHIRLKERDPVMGEKLNPGDTQRMLRAWEVLEETSRSIHEWQQEMPEPYYAAGQFRGVFLHPEREWLYARCNSRFDTMLEEGALEEVRQVMGKGLSPDLPSMKILGVPELIAYLSEEQSLEEAKEQAKQATRNYAKRQLTWFRNQSGHYLKEVVYSPADGDIMPRIKTLLTP